MKINKPIILLTSFFAMLPQGQAAENLLLTGVNISKQANYSYVGAIMPLVKSLDETGSRVRLWADYLDFDYERNNLPEVNVNGPSFHAAIGYQWSFTQTKVATYIGAVYRNLSEDRNANTRDIDKKWGVDLQAEVDHHFNDSYGVAIIASHATNINNNWARIQPYYQCANSIRIGPEIVGMSGNGYNKQQYGLFVQGIDLGFASMSTSVGYEHIGRINDSSAYGTVNLNIKF